jgi:hypothetical protein
MLESVAADPPRKLRLRDAEIHARSESSSRITWGWGVGIGNRSHYHKREDLGTALCSPLGAESRCEGVKTSFGTSGEEEFRARPEAAVA